MLIAQQKRRDNIVEYVLYMWHIEDLIRSFEFDLNAIEEKVVSEFDTTDEIKKEIKEWYSALIKNMKDQKIVKNGHLLEIRDLMYELSYLHKTLITIYQDKTYAQLYAKALPNIRELKEKSGGLEQDEIVTCLNGMYGILLLKMSQKGITEETNKAIETISQLLAYLANKYKEVLKGKHPFPKSINN